MEEPGNTNDLHQDHVLQDNETQIQRSVFFLLTTTMEQTLDHPSPYVNVCMCARV